MTTTVVTTDSGRTLVSETYEEVGDLIREAVEGTGFFEVHGARDGLAVTINAGVVAAFVAGDHRSKMDKDREDHVGIPGPGDVTDDNVYPMRGPGRGSAGPAPP